jgi:hypothetical protein
MVRENTTQPEAMAVDEPWRKLQAYARLFADTAPSPNASTPDFERLAYAMVSLAAMAYQSRDFAIRRGVGPLRDPEFK